MADETNILTRFIRPIPLSVFCITFLGFYIVQRFNVSIEAAQTVFFPLFVLALMKLPRSRALHLPQTLVATSLGCWAICALHIRGYLPEIFSQEHIALSRLEREASNEQYSRELFRRYNIIARAYHLPPMEIVARRFDEQDDAQDWIDHSSSVSLILSGSPEWLYATFAPLERKLSPSSERPKESEFLLAILKEWDIDFRRDHVSLIQPHGLSTPVLLAYLPRSVALPTEPPELTLHFLAWLARSITANCEAPELYGNKASELGRSSNFSTVQEQACAEDSISQMTNMLGSWRSPAPLSLARLMIGTTRLAENLSESSANNQGMVDAASELNAAQKMLRKEQYAELMSLVRNNFGVARAFVAQTDDDYMKARKEFLGTASIIGEDGRPTVGARAAMVNLILLERAGLL